ncbi:MAG: ATP-binding cassette domain-containing protein [Ruminococcus sp.]|uniref:ABC transporter ATP-binding protein n=1 Tax=Ruminococcus sp. TaxID=41978 RepID=UPI0025E5A431|nr:ATP-binding cassette domain-containing protein [Ruminococcus sp.]MCR5601541.1 ATP-binding cassette domain-containing protein [Ruminococcus sp.]
MDYVLKTNALCKQYKDFKALSGVTMSVPKGSVYGFVGRNGAGKTTLIRLICGMQFPTDGEFEIYGVKNTDAAISDSRKRIGAVVETPSLFPEMTAQDNLKYQYRLLGLPSFEGITELLKLVGLENTGKKKAKDFSLGMRQRLGIAVALCGNPDFLILDEPINGLDPQGIIEIRELILKLNRERNITVLISSHILDELARLATHYGFIDKGSIVREMSAEDLEAACRKCIRVTVTDTSAAVRALDDMKLEYRVIGDNYIDIYAKPNISKLSAALEKENCEILSCTEHDETLEGFFISLVGGGSDE